MGLFYQNRHNMATILYLRISLKPLIHSQNPSCIIFGQLSSRQPYFKAIHDVLPAHIKCGGSKTTSLKLLSAKGKFVKSHLFLQSPVSGYLLTFFKTFSHVAIQAYSAIPVLVSIFTPTTIFALFYFIHYGTTGRAIVR